MSEFKVSATDRDEAVEIGHEAFRAALLKAGAPLTRRIGGSTLAQG